MTTGGYPPPQSDPQNPGAYPGSNPQYGGPHNGQQYGGQQPGYPQPNDYTQQFPKQGGPGPGYTPDGGGQYGTPQYGNQYGAPQQGAPQYGAPQHGAPQYGAPQYGAPQSDPYGSGPQFGQGAPGFPPAPAPGQGFGQSRPGELLPRLGARIIDGLIVGIPMGILTAIVTFGSDSGFMALLMSVLSGAVAFGYWTYLESSRGATFGKQLLGLSVVAPGGGRLTLEQAGKRNAFVALQALTGIPILGWLISIALLAAYIGIAVTIEQDGNKQGFHDKFAGGTQVVKS